jgi:hypothetical protein
MVPRVSDVGFAPTFFVPTSPKPASLQWLADSSTHCESGLSRKGRTRYPYGVYRWLSKLTTYIRDAIAQHKPQLRNAGVIYARVAVDSARDALEEYRAANPTCSFPIGFSVPSFTISITSGAKVHD